METRDSRPSDETNRRQLELAQRQGHALADALREMIHEEARGEERRCEDYLVGWATEEAEGMWVPEDDGELRWREPGDENCHLEISVRDAGDGRFVPGLTVHATLVDADGDEVGTHRQPFVWHPWLYHYGRNWQVPASGSYLLRVRIDPPSFPRHDRVNGERYRDVVTVEFEGVRVETGVKRARA